MRTVVLPALLAALTSAALFLSAAGGGITFVAYFVQLPLFYLGFAWGLTSAALASTVALVIVLAAGGGVVGGVFLVTEAGPCLLVIRQALLFRRRDGRSEVEWYPVGTILGGLTAAAALVVLVVFLLVAEEEGGIAGQFQAAAETLGAALPSGGDSAAVIGRLNDFAPYLAGIAAASWLLMTVVNGLLGYALAARGGKAVRGPPSPTRIVLPRWCAPAFLVATAFAFVAGDEAAYVARSLAVVFAVPFFLQGLAVVHTLVHRAPSPRVTLALFYLALLLLSPLVPILVATLGLVEERARLRPNLT